MRGARKGGVEGVAAFVQHRINTSMKVSKFIERRKEERERETERERGGRENEKAAA